MSRLRNAFYAQAVCDAVGAPFEFGDPQPSEVLKFAINGKLEITDDTQMALFGQEAVNRCYRVTHAKPMAIHATLCDAVEKAYLRWYETQSETREVKPGHFGLQAEPLMRHCRAPGNACMSSLRRLAKGKPSYDRQVAISNNHNGCGAVMRLLPFAGLMESTGDFKFAQSIALKSAAITHGHPEVAIAVELYMRAADEALRGDWSQRNDFVTTKSITNLGEGWTSLECVMMALWAVANSKSFEELLVNSICHPGDSDSVAAVAGSIWGLYGHEVPTHMLDRLVEKKVIDKVLADADR